MARLYREERVPLVVRLLEERPWCEFPDGCSARSEGLHELLKRSGGGSIVDEANIATSCHFHNEFAENEPAYCESIGWVRRARP
jgi:hypothetical protein